MSAPIRTRWLLALALGAALPASVAAQSQQAQAQPVRYPATRTIEHVDDYHGTRVADPYRWLEELNAPATGEWVAAQNGVTFGYLASLPLRETLKRRITELYNYPRVSTPWFEGGRWFYTRNTGLQRQGVIFTRPTLTAAERVAIDPNALSPDGSVALSNFVPSPDGRHVAVGQSEGGSDWSTYHVRRLADGAITSDTVRWVKFSGISWTEDGRGFFYGRYPEPEAGKQLATRSATRRSTTTCSARRSRRIAWCTSGPRSRCSSSAPSRTSRDATSSSPRARGAATRTSCS
jgi:prolyl oligopeptidase